MLDVELGTEILEYSVAKLLAIINNDGMKISESTDDRLSEKVLDFTLDDVCQRFYLYPFDKIVNDDDEELLLASY